MLNVITRPCLIFNGAVEVREWVSKYIPLFLPDLITYVCPNPDSVLTNRYKSRHMWTFDQQCCAGSLNPAHMSHLDIKRINPFGTVKCHQSQCCVWTNSDIYIYIYIIYIIYMYIYVYVYVHVYAFFTEFLTTGNMSSAKTCKSYLWMQKVPSGPRPEPHGCSWWRCKGWARRHDNNGSRGNDEMANTEKFRLL